MGFDTEDMSLYHVDDIRRYANEGDDDLVEAIANHFNVDVCSNCNGKGEVYEETYDGILDCDDDEYDDDYDLFGDNKNSNGSYVECSNCFGRGYN